MKIENLKQAINFLSKNFKYNFERINNNLWNMTHSCNAEPELMKSGEIVALARKCNRKRYAKIIKWNNNKRNRSARKRLMHHQQFDKLHPKKQENSDNIRNWD